jgi:hypothetical protein
MFQSEDWRVSAAVPLYLPVERERAKRFGRRLYLALVMVIANSTRENQMASSTSSITRDHDEIRRWAEERGGRPAHVAKTGSQGDIGVLRIEFPGAPGSKDENLEELSWDQFFEKFDERGLALLYQEETAGGARSNFNKLISAETADAEEGGDGSRSRRAASSRRSGGSNRGGSSRQSSAKKTAPRQPSRGASTAKKSAAKKGQAKSASVQRNAGGTARKASAQKAGAQNTARKKSAAKTGSRSTARKSAPARKSGSRAGAKNSAANRSASRSSQSPRSQGRSSKTKRSSAKKTSPRGRR